LADRYNTGNRNFERKDIQKSEVVRTVLYREMSRGEEREKAKATRDREIKREILKGYKKDKIWCLMKEKGGQQK